MMSDVILTSHSIQSITTLAERALKASDKVQIVELPKAAGERQILIVKPDGTYERESLPNGPRLQNLFSVDQVAPFVDVVRDRWNCSPSVYFSLAGVKVEIEDDQPNVSNLGFANVGLSHSKQFKLLSGFADNRDNAWRDHSSFIRMLRLDFETCIDTQILEYTLKSLSAYEASDGSKVQSTVVRNRESLGKEVLAELRSSAGEIPEQLALQVRVFQDRALRRTRRIFCKLETDPRNGGRFALIPMADEIENAIEEEMSELGSMLDSAINGNSIAKITGPVVDTPTAAVMSERDPVPVIYGTH